MTGHEILEWLGSIPGNETVLPLLVEQMQTPIGVVPFIGAGMSVPAGFPSWTAFLRDGAKLAGITRAINKRITAGEYEEAAEDVETALTAGRFQDLIRSYFGDRVLAGRTFTGALPLLPRLSNGPVITTNFDRVLEHVYRNEGCAFGIVIAHSQLELGVQALQGNEDALLKFHGDWEDPGNRVLTANEYAREYGDPDAALGPGAPLPMLFTLLGIRPLLFLGCNLVEDRTVKTLLRVATGLKSSRHYAVVQRLASPTKFRARARFLATHNIRPVWYPEGEHHRIERLLEYLGEQLPHAYRRKMRSVEATPVAHGLPTLLTRFIGRARELEDLSVRAMHTRLLTLAGPPGVGKTRLAIELTRSLAPAFESAWFVELSQMAEPHLVAQRMATVMGIREQARRPPTESIAEFLGTHHYLIVLDNCEHVRAACTGLVDYLLRQCPNITVIATTREILKVAGEDVGWIPPLTQPDMTGTVAAREVGRADAVLLFIDRANRALTLTDDNVSEVAQLCRELEGIPLAIELAAAQVASVTVKQLLQHMDERLSILVGGRGGTAERQWETLRQAIQFSYEQLDSDSQQLFRRLSVFRGGWTWEAATAVCGAGFADTFAILRELNELHGRSLLVIEDGHEVKRFRLLDSIRQFAAGELAGRGEAAAIDEAHAAWFTAFAERAAPELLKRDQVRWLELLVEDVDNFRGAMLGAVSRGDTELALRLMVALWRLTEIRGYWREGRERLEMVLAMPAAAEYPELRTKALAGLGMLAYRQGEMETAKARFAESLELARSLNDTPGMANAFNDLGNVAQMEGDFDAAYRYYADGLTLERETGNDRGIAVSLFNAGNCARRLGRFADAGALFEQSRQAFESAGNRREAAFPINALGLVAVAQRRYDEAIGHAEKSLAMRRELADNKGIGDCLRTLGMAYLGKGDIARAGRHLGESLDLARSIEDKRSIAETLELCARAAAITRDFAATATLYAAAKQIREQTHIRLAPLEEVQPTADLADARAALGDPELELRQSTGRQLSLDELSRMADAIAGRDPNAVAST